MDNSQEVEIKFHLDENVSSAIAKGLRQKNIDVTTTDEVNLIGVSDEEQLFYTLNQKRVILTHDADFLRLHKRGLQHAGIVYCSQQKLKTISTGEIISFLEFVYQSMTIKTMANHLEFMRSL